MKQRYPKFNPKRKLIEMRFAQSLIARLDELACNVRYGGNPAHKKNPGDYGLCPPSDPRHGKSLCDDAGVFTRVEALRLLREGVRRGLVSVREKNGWPQNVWSLTATGIPLEAQLENASMGIYHGYPISVDDPFAATIKTAWERRRVENRICM